MERESQVSITVDDYESLPDSDSESSSESSDRRRFTDFTTIGMRRLKGDEREYGVIRKCFVVGMGILAKEVSVVAIHKNSYSTAAGQARFQAFKIFAKAVATRRRGDANLKSAWYGGARDEILGIVTHGFGRCGPFDDVLSHGIGVHLSSMNAAFDCALGIKEDEHGVRHILLCRVILGNTEPVAAGSRQFQPSSTDFDSGIDNPLSPTKFTIWSHYMNSHIFPTYIISFTIHPLTVRSLPNSRLELPVLMNVLSRFLHPSRMSSISDCYNDFRENKIDKLQLIRKLRSLVGNQMLVSAIKLCRDKRV